MGDPRKTRKKYERPEHPWNKTRIEAERILMRTYGLKNKRELWKAQSTLTHFKDITKHLIAKTSDQSQKERIQLFTKLTKLGLLSTSPRADDVLGLTIEQILDRRLQTLVHKRGLSHTVSQARQFITHGHITVNGQKKTMPSALVSVLDEAHISFSEQSQLHNPDHPERVVKEKKAGKEEVKSAEKVLEEEAPVTETKKADEKKKPLTEQIEDETTNKLEVEEAVKTAESDAIAADHKQEIKKEAEGDDA